MGMMCLVAGCAFLLPMTIADRFPFPSSIQPTVIPNMYTHTLAILGVVCCLVEVLMPTPMRIRLEKRHQDVPTTTASAALPFNYVQSACGFLSAFYNGSWFLFMWRSNSQSVIPQTVEQPLSLTVLQISYHVAWSLIRPTYTLLYVIYLFKDTDLHPNVRAALRWFIIAGILHFSTLGSASAAGQGSDAWRVDVHLLENTGWFAAMFLFWFYGIHSDWKGQNPRETLFRSLMTSGIMLGLMTFPWSCAEIVASYNTIDFFTVIVGGVEITTYCLVCVGSICALWYGCSHTVLVFEVTD